MEQQSRGRLTIFFSYSRGIGKTHAMLKAAWTAKERGVDTVVGYLAPHAVEKTKELLDGLELLFDPESGEEFPLELALKRRPELILVDELAHTNRGNCRHSRRYLDVEELLKSGIDVYTTVNVGNIESLYDTVVSITGDRDWERIPDAVFDGAAQVRLIDIEPGELMDSLKEEKEVNGQAATVERLTALRELALRRCADRVKSLADRLQKPREYQMEEHILACLSSAPSNAKIIRSAARMAAAFNSRFTALFVETPDFAAQTEEDKKRLEENRRLAKELGAKTETVYGEDVPYQIAEFARLSGITKIVLGQSATRRRFGPGGTPLSEQLIFYAPEIDIHIIPDGKARHPYRPRKRKNRRPSRLLKNTAVSAGILLASTALSMLMDQIGFTEANLIMVYIMGTVLTSVATSHWSYSLVSSAAGVFIFNYLFTTPRLSLTAYETGYPLTFLVMFLTAFITGTLAMRYKEQAAQSARIANRTRLLFDTSQMLAKAKKREEIYAAAAGQIVKLTGLETVMFDGADGNLSPPRIFVPSSSDGASVSERTAAGGQKSGNDGFSGEAGGYDMKKEEPVVRWVYEHNHEAGAATDTLSNSDYLYLALRVSDRVYGVVGLRVEEHPLDASVNGILLSILGECALALENEKNAREKEEAAVLAESEQLRANLLRTISHDLRTPLTSIYGSAGILLNSGENLEAEEKRQLYLDIYHDAAWLTDLVENLLYATRIEEGRMKLKTSAELVSDIVESAILHIGRKAEGYHLTVNCEDELLLVRADGRLVEQVLVNLVDNALKYTEPGSSIAITARKSGSMALIQVSDDGPGIPDGEKERIFDKFYCGQHKIADNRRSLGLGLFLCRAIVEAHGGTIGVTDRDPHGAVFGFTLPLEEVVLHE